MADKVAVVTGSNKGLGYGIVEELCRRGVGVVYLTARDPKKGLEAVEKIKRKGFNPEFHQLDISDRNSVKKFAEHLKRKHCYIDILINNAAVIPQCFKKILYEDSKQVIDINYKSYFHIQEYLFPILNDNARVINITSCVGHITNIKNKYWINRLTKHDIQVQDIDSFVEWFLTSVKNGTLKEEDFIETNLLSYKISKVAICALTRIQQREIGRNISINSVHPGYIRTDMTRQTGEITVEEASQTPVYLALDCDQSLKGKYIWFDKREVDWTDLSIDILASHNQKEIEKFLMTS